MSWSAPRASTAGWRLCAVLDQGAVGEHGQGQVAVQAVPAPALLVIEPAFALAVFVERLNGSE
jgi:hypothetical protein